MQILEQTKSICPTCFYQGLINKIDASIIEDDGKIWLTKICDKHGSFQKILFDDVNLYKKWMKFKVSGMPVSYVNKKFLTEPEFYIEHLSQIILTNLMIKRLNYLYFNKG